MKPLRGDKQAESFPLISVCVSAPLQLNLASSGSLLKRDIDAYPEGLQHPPTSAATPHHPAAPGALGHQLLQPAHTLPLPHARCRAHT